MAKKPDGMIALSLVGEINAYHLEAMKSANNAVLNILQMGRRLLTCKEDIEHGEWEKWVNQYCDFSMRTTQAAMKMARDYSEIADGTTKKLVIEATSITEVRSLLSPVSPRPKAQSVALLSTSGGEAESQDVKPSAQNDDAAAPETCPNCGGTNYDRDEDGSYCEDCKEPAEKPPEYEPDPSDEMKEHLLSRVTAIGIWVGGKHTKDVDIPSFDDIADAAGMGAGDKRKKVIGHLDKAYQEMKKWLAQIH